MRECIGIMTGGGDCPGLNAVIRAVVKSATKRGCAAIGFLGGYEVILIEAIGRLRTVPLDGDIVQTARALGITFGD